MIDVQRVDITTLKVDAIVNAAGRSLRGGGGVDGAIHQAAGRELLKACIRVGPCEPGDAKITPGFRLPSRFVIHAVGPRWRGGERGERELLARCYRRAMELAKESDIRSIAFPAISCGVYGFPVGEAAKIAIHEVQGALTAGSGVQEIIFACLDQAVFASFRAYLGEMQN